MESRGGAVLSLGQHLAPFGELPQQEEEGAAASGPPWRGGGREEEEGDAKTTASRSHATPPEPQAGAGADGEERRWELRRRLGRSFSLPASPSLEAARLFSGHDRDGEEEGTTPSGGLGCCTKCKKRVQFADALGLCLASVKHFSAADEPQVPPAVLSRLQSFPLGQKDLAEFSAALAGLGGCAPSPLPPFPGRPGQQLKPEPLLVASRLDGAGGPPDAERLRARRVCLEEVAGTALAGVPLDVRGVVRVLSCPGPKEVMVRYTFNEWLSFLDAPAVALPPARQPDASESFCPVERYQFSLCLPPGLPEGSAVHFALCYRSQQGEHWDNNGGANYTLRGGSSPEKPSSPFY